MDVDDIENYLEKEDVDIAVICTPKNVCQQVADQIVKCGIKAIWNLHQKI